MSWTASQDGWVENNKEWSSNGTDGMILFDAQARVGHLILIARRLQQWKCRRSLRYWPLLSMSYPWKTLMEKELISPAAMEHCFTKTVNDWPRLVTSGASRHDMAASRLDFCEVKSLDTAT